MTSEPVRADTMRFVYDLIVCVRDYLSSADHGRYGTAYRHANRLTEELRGCLETLEAEEAEEDDVTT